MPTMRLRTYPAAPSWWEPFETSTVEVQRSDPLIMQLRHFCGLIRGDTTPLVSGRDGLETLRATLAVTEAARTGEVIRLG
jgi:predicted dehydrogenase